MDTPGLIEALRAKYESLQVDFGDAAADRLREVVEHALGQITGASRARGAAKAGKPRKRGGRSWTPEQRAEQRRKMEAYWAGRRKTKAPRKARAKGNAEAAAAS